MQRRRAQAASTEEEPDWTAWPAPAKLNLFLHIVGRRADGYHLLETVFQLLDRGDTVVGTPNETLLPPWARYVLRTALAEAGVTGAGVVALHRPGQRPEWSLGLRGTEALDEGARLRLTWYLPPHIGLVHGGPHEWVGEAALL